MRIKGLILGLILLAMSAVAYSQAVYVLDTTVYACEDQHEPINLVKSTGMQLTPNSGFWVRVTPGSHTNNNIPIEADTIIEENVSPIFTLEDKAAGRYEFIYVATATQFCGINRDDFIRVIVDVLPSAETIDRFACGGVLIQLDDILKAEGFEQSEIENTKWVVLNSTMDPIFPFDQSLDTINRTYNTAGREDQEVFFSYTVGRTKVKCNDGYLVLKVGSQYNQDLLPDSVYKLTCMGNLATPSDLNLNSVMGISQGVYNGTWTVVSSSSSLINSSDVTIDADGFVSVSGSSKPFPQVGEFVFKYTYKTEFCTGGTTDVTSVLTLTIKEDLTADFVGTDTVFCEDYGTVDLYSLINNIYLPPSAGTWDVYFNGTLIQDSHLIPFDINNGVLYTPLADVGTYTFKYFVSQAAQGLCGLAGTNVEFAVNITEATEIMDAARQMCATSSQTINLYNVFNEHINPNNWEIYYSGTMIPMADAVAYSPSGHSLIAGQSHLFNYRYSGSAAGHCGVDTANFYLTLRNDNLDIANQNRYFCHYIGADEINIAEILGVIGIDGEWQVQNNVLNNTFTVDASGNEITLTGTTVTENTGLFFKGKQQYDADVLSSGVVGDKTYVFTFTPNSRNSCISDTSPKTVTITIGEDITQ
ncbi:MAG: hypothetical protein ACK5IQ_09865 [Bacteroidales bacterium]